MFFFRPMIALAFVIVCAVPSLGAGQHAEPQIAAAQTFTYHGIGFKDKPSRSRETFTNQFPESAGDATQIDDQGQKDYEATLENNKKIKAKYLDGILYELEVISPRLQTSYKKLTEKFGPPDRAQEQGRGFSWTLGNMRITLKIDRTKEVVVYHDTEYRQTVAKMTKTSQP